MRTIKELKSFAYKNKLRDVKGEHIFRKALQGFKIHYQRQKVIKKYIVDFYLPKRNLIIEIDGSYHAGCKEYDDTRKNELRDFGWKVLTFSDSQVFNDINFCIEQILAENENSKNYRESKRRLALINR